MAAARMAGTSSPDQGVKRMRGALAAAVGVLVGTAALTGTSPVQAKDIVLKMAVPDWPPTRIMQDLAAETLQDSSATEWHAARQ